MVTTIVPLDVSTTVGTIDHELASCLYKRRFLYDMILWWFISHVFGPVRLFCVVCLSAKRPAALYFTELRIGTGIQALVPLHSTA